MNAWRVESTRFPYVPLRLTFGGSTDRLEGLLDTGFDGDIVVPADYPTRGMRPVTRNPANLADGTEVWIPTYAGAVQVGDVQVAPVFIFTLGDHVLIGTNLIKRFNVILDHGRRVIVEP
jgi:predicted aspartyl protease